MPLTPDQQAHIARWIDYRAHRDAGGPPAWPGLDETLEIIAVLERDLKLATDRAQEHMAALLSANARVESLLRQLSEIRVIALRPDQ